MTKGDAPSDEDLDALFVRLRLGDSEASGALTEALYSELRAGAARYFRMERGHRAVDPEALVHEAYLRLRDNPAAIKDRRHFFALAAQAIRRALVDHAREQAYKRRVADKGLVVDQVSRAMSGDDVVLALDEALRELEATQPRAAKVVELRFFGGYTDKQVGEVLGIGPATVTRDWMFARVFLSKRVDMIGGTEPLFKPVSIVRAEPPTAQVQSLTIELDSSVTPESLTEALAALSSYFRACGGVRLEAALQDAEPPAPRSRYVQ